MIVWIASYPRSGNTLLRAILNRCFGEKSYSIYDSIESDEMAPLVGHAPLGMQRDDFLAYARASTETFYVKTHLYPSDAQEKAIYIVRDGRAALSSHRSYCKDIEKRTVPLESLVLGVHQKIVWARHVEDWLKQSSVLLLRFEELTSPSHTTLEQISAFLRLPIVREFDLTFGDLHAIHPNFFRAGRNDEGVAEVEHACPALFWRTHGKVMRQLGYAGTADNLKVSELRSAYEYLSALWRFETLRSPVPPYPHGLRTRYRRHGWHLLGEALRSSVS